ncbi:MAG: HEPN domain-containing protein [Caldisericaceae bacterium]
MKDCYEKELLRVFKFDRSVVKKEISNAKRHLTNAKKCVKDEMYDLVVVSVYTSMFHAARAILYRDGFKERSHICLIEYIREKYPKLNDFLKILDTYREKACCTLWT